MRLDSPVRWDRVRLWARGFQGLQSITPMASPPTVTWPVNTTLSAINASNNGTSLPAAGSYANLSTFGYAASAVGTGNPNANHLRTFGPANTDSSQPIANLVTARFVTPLPQFEVVLVENTGSKLNAVVDGQLVTAGGVGVIPNGVQSGGTRYVKFDFGADTTSYGMAAANVSAAGSGYAAGDTITLSGGTFTRPATYRVGFVNTGAVGNLYIQDAGDYTVLPAFPAATTTSGSGTGLTIATGFTFPRHTTFKPREIELLLDGPYLYGLNYTAPASGEPAITAFPRNPLTPSVYWLGDSQDANTYGTYAGGHVGHLACRRLGLTDNLTIDARGGTGFNVANGTAPAFEHANRVAAVIAARPDILVFPYSQNVGANSQQTSQAAAISFVQQIQGALPSTLIIMVGPAAGHQSWHLAAMQAVAAAVTNTANFRMIDTITEGWDAGGSTGYLTSDNTHWGMYGNLEWRSKLLARRIGYAICDMALNG